MSVKVLHSALFCILWSLLKYVGGLPPKQPHIIFIFADDLGWNDVSFHGSLQIPTPNIDALSHDGIILNNYYVQPLCSPSRGALMTGKYPIELGLQHHVIKTAAPQALQLNEIILPQRLKDLGYATHGLGKWHLGFVKDGNLPFNRGFDSYFGYWTGRQDYFSHWSMGGDNNSYVGLDFHSNYENEWGYNGVYSTEIFTKKAVDIIENHDLTKPLFLYFAHQAVHVGNWYAPFQAPLHYLENFSHIQDEQRRIFAGMVTALDDSVGQVFAALDRVDMLEDSVVIFSTDNGGETEGYYNGTGSNFPLRGGKFTVWEGGVRGAACVWSHSLRNNSKVSNKMMHVTDWLPTLYALAGGNPEELENIDGVNQWPSICCGHESARQEILLNIDPEWKLEGIRKGKYKLVKGTCFDGYYDGWFDKEGKKRVNIDYTEEELSVQRQSYKEAAQHSLVQEVLLKHYGKEYFENVCNPDATEFFHGNGTKCFNPLTVNCRPYPRNTLTACNPSLEPCLFNVEDDPCEYNNIAAIEPQVLKELEESLNFYRQKAVPITNQPNDPASNPALHGYVWIPWR